MEKYITGKENIPEESKFVEEIKINQDQNWKDVVFGKENNENEEKLQNELSKRMKNSKDFDSKILGLKFNN